MRKSLGFLSAIITVLILLLNSAAPMAAFEDFDDANGHWAESTLRQAHADGIIGGVGGSLFPDSHISNAQALGILCRALGAEKTANISGYGLSGDEWYYHYVAKSAYLGLISPADITEFDAPVTRQYALYLIAEAFSLVESNPDVSALERFTDYGLIAGPNRQAIASLVSQGLVSGNNDRLRVNDYATRAEFLSIIYRIVNGFIPSSGVQKKYSQGITLQGPAHLVGSAFSGGVWFDCTASVISFNSVVADRVVVRSHSLDSLVIGSYTHIGRLTLAAQSGDITVSPENNSVVGALVVGSGGGRVAARGVGVIEITGSGRHVIITGRADSVVVAGKNSTVHVQPGARVGKIDILRTASDSRVIVDGNLSDLTIVGLGAKVEGRGYVDTLVLSRAHCEVSVNHGAMLDNIDQGIIEASIRISLPDRLPAGSTLNAAAIIDNAAPGKTGDLVWYIDGVQVSKSTITTGSELPGLSYGFTYSRSMPDSAVVRAVLRYVTVQGERQEISAESTIRLENYNKLYWTQHDAPRVLQEVTSAYRGDFTLEWAMANDIDDFDKEVWVNAKGYASNSEYLLWINNSYQRVNVFKGSVGNWELIRTCIVGTGSLRTPTRQGVTTTTYKQINGWTTRSYSCRPVVRFRPGSGYAFHSRLYYPNSTTRLADDRIGFPISLGCIRMYDDDIWFIFNNVPDGSTVVIF